jgi:hypothetical protein
MESEEDPFLTLERMLASKGKRKSPSKSVVKSKIEVKKIVAEAGADKEACGSGGNDVGAVEDLASDRSSSHDSEEEEDEEKVVKRRVLAVPKKTLVSFGPIVDAAQAKAIVEGVPAAVPKKKNKRR